MAYYLSMNGTTSDFLKTPSVTFDEIIFDMYVEHTSGVGRFYYDSRIGFTAYVYRETNNTDRSGGSVSTMYVDGVQKTWGTAFVPNMTRCIFRATHTASGTDDVNLFSNNAGTQNQKGRLYNVTFKNAGTVTAFYDMTLGEQIAGTVQDQSGNGKHATLTGGTWVNESSGTNYPVSLSDTMTLSETVSKIKSMIIIDTVAMSDSKTDNTSKSFSDTVTVTDSVLSTKGKAVNLSDALTITDTIKKAITQLKTDSVSLADSDTKNIIKAFNDSLTLSDSISTMKGKAVLLTDSLNVTDSIKKVVGKLQTDNLSLSDSASRQANVTAKLYDVVLIADSMQTALPNAPSIVRVVQLEGGIKAVIELKGEVVISVTRPPISLEGDATPTTPAELRGEV